MAWASCLTPALRITGQGSPTISDNAPEQTKMREAPSSQRELQPFRGLNVRHASSLLRFPRQLILLQVLEVAAPSQSLFIRGEVVMGNEVHGNPEESAGHSLFPCI